MPTESSKFRRKFRHKVAKGIKANSDRTASAGAIKQLAFTRTQQAIKGFAVRHDEAIAANAPKSVDGN